MSFDAWTVIMWCYLAAASITLVPMLIALFRGVELNPGGISFDETKSFSEEARTRLVEHYSRIQGTLGFWKKQATIYTRFHYYCVIWTILSAWAVPIIGSNIPTSDPASAKWLLIVVSGHVAVSLSFHRGLHVAEAMKSFRLGESDFYDLYRRLLDRPIAFGETEDQQLDKYFRQVELIRKIVRNAETETTPDADEFGVGIRSE